MEGGALFDDPRERAAAALADTHKAVNVLLTPHETLTHSLYRAVLSKLSAQNDADKDRGEESRESSLFRRRLGFFGPDDQLFSNIAAYNEYLRDTYADESGLLAEDSDDFEVLHILRGTLKSPATTSIPPSFHHETENAAETISDFLEKFDLNTDGAKAFVDKVGPQLKKADSTLLQILVPKQKWRDHVAAGPEGSEKAILLRSDAGLLNADSGFRINWYSVTSLGRTVRFKQDPDVERAIEDYAVALVPPMLSRVVTAVEKFNDDVAMKLRDHHELTLPARLAEWHEKGMYAGPGIPLGDRLGRYAFQVKGAEYCVASKRDLSRAGLSMAERADGTFWPTTGVPPDVPLRRRDRQRTDYEYVRDAIFEYNSKTGRRPLQIPTRDLVTNWDESSHSRFQLEMNNGKDSIVFFTGRGYQVVKADQLEAFNRRSRGSDRSR